MKSGNQETARQTALRLADDFFTSAGQETDCRREIVRSLCEMAASPDEETARAGVTGLFPALVERLNDSFKQSACALYDQVFSQVIEFFRRLPAGRELDAELRRFGLPDEEALLERKARLLKQAPFVEDAVKPVKKIILLSRVTLGADVAVTSVIIAALRNRFPAAEFVLLGSAKLRELFGGDARVRVRELGYERGGGVLARLNSWLEVAAAVAAEERDCGPEAMLVIDPDSRLTQLGLLPVRVTDRNYFFFESRSYRQPGLVTLAQLTAHWCHEVFGADPQAVPFVALPQKHLNLGKAVAEKLRRANARRLVSISLGVGGNERKRVHEKFEAELLGRLLSDDVLLLDKGGNAEEREQINRLLATLCVLVIEVNEQNAIEGLQAEELNAKVLTWDGGIGAFAGLIAASDEYIGYDSAGQHIAAALGVPTLTVFVNANTPVFAERWRPCGLGKVEVVDVEAAQLTDEESASALILRRALAARENLRRV